MQESLTGVKVPCQLLPLQIRLISLIIPLTIVINLSRIVFLNNITYSDILYYFVYNIIYFFIVFVLQKETINKKIVDGSINFY